MEIKKSSKADLEGKRTQRFLFGVVVSLAFLFIALEYSFDADDPLDDPELLERLESDIELPPMLHEDNEVSLAPKAEPKPSLILKIAEEQELPEQEEPQPEEPLEGDMTDILPEEDTIATTPPAEPLPFRIVEQMPEFPGGHLEFIKWLTRNLKYPQLARQARQQGKVVVEFIVNEDGSVTDINVVKPLCRPCDNEALRVMRMMPRWTAGIDKGEPCRTKVCVPIIFKL